MRTQVLIVGSGIAGLLAAIELVENGVSVVLACKSKLLDSNTALAQGGLAAVSSFLDFKESLNDADSVQKHIDDTLKSGAGLCERRAVESLIKDAPDLIARLCQLGVSFDRARDGSFDLAREGGHSAARVLHAKDATGKAIASALIARLHHLQRIHAHLVTIVEEALAIELLLCDQGVTGCAFIRGNQAIDILAPYTILATGGAGRLYERTTNPPIATGDGVALAYRAGAALVDLEFMQFHPTALAVPNAPCLLISEAVRGAGATLKDRSGDPFVRRFHADGDLATRDVVSRAIHETMTEQASDCVYLDMRSLGAASIEERFPNIARSLAPFGIDPAHDLIPVAPAAHYFMGGIAADENGKTSLQGLLAIGECASTGLHGANRLASNSLLEGAVMARRACRQILKDGLPDESASLSSVRSGQGGFGGQGRFGGQGGPVILLPADVELLRKEMYRSAGLVRDRRALSAWLERLDELEGSAEKMSLPVARANSRSSGGAILAAANLLLLARLVSEAALARKESRGCHLRSDYPERDDLHFGERRTVVIPPDSAAGQTRALQLPVVLRHDRLFERERDHSRKLASGSSRS